MDRRRLLERGAVVAAGAWAAPVVRSLPAAAQTQQGSAPPEVGCVGGVLDVRAVLAGPVDATQGSSVTATAGTQARTCTGGKALVAPGRAVAYLSYEGFCVGSTSTGSRCTTYAEITSVLVDLRHVDPMLDLQLTASQVRAEATQECGLAAGGSASLEAAQLVVAGTSVSLAASPSANTQISTPASSSFSFLLTLNARDGSGVRAVHLYAATKAPVAQTVDIVVSYAEAGCG